MILLLISLVSWAAAFGFMGFLIGHDTGYKKGHREGHETGYRLGLNIGRTSRR